MSFKSPLPDHVVKLIEKSQRQALGLRTMDEKVVEAEVKSERDLHKAVANLLRLRGIEFFESRMDRKTTRPKGEPDFLFCVLVKDFDKEKLVVRYWPVAVAFELKVAGRPLSEAQQAMFKRMTTPPNAWKCVVIRSVLEAVVELRRLGL